MAVLEVGPQPILRARETPDVPLVIREDAKSHFDTRETLCTPESAQWDYARIITIGGHPGQRRGMLIVERFKRPQHQVRV